MRCDPSDSNALISADGSEYHHQHETWAPIAVLVVSDQVFYGNKGNGSPAECSGQIVQRLAITSETTAFVKAGLAIDEHFLLPLSQHSWHRRHLGLTVLRSNWMTGDDYSCRAWKSSASTSDRPVVFFNGYSLDPWRRNGSGKASASTRQEAGTYI